MIYGHLLHIHASGGGRPGKYVKLKLGDRGDGIAMDSNPQHQKQIGSFYDTLWLFNSLPWKIAIYRWLTY